jgi:uncharacterized protein
MKIAILGASGWIGSHIVNEAKARGHSVIALVRDTNKIDNDGVEVRQFDLLDTNANLATATEGVDAVISAIGGRAIGNHEIVKNTALKLLQELPQAGIERLLWVGGAGSLEVAPGVELISVSEFPEEYKPESIAMGEALAVFRQTDSALNWTFISPAAEIFPGEKEQNYRIGKDELLMDEEGKCRISVSDYAVAMIDELENSVYPKQRIGVAY